MRLIEKLRAELVDIVEWVDDGRNSLVWRFPRYHNQIKHGAQLIVRPGQAAIFVHQGRVADVFQPGQHRLETRNLPLLSTLRGWAYGFDSPFKAEVYFVSTRQVTGLKWGTPNPVPMRDPDFGPIRVRAFGTYTLRAADPRALLRELVGTDAEFDVAEVSELIRSIIHSSFADLLANADIGVLDLASNYGELSEELRRTVVSRIDDEYGLDIPQLYIVNVSLPAEVEKALDTRARMEIVGDVARFQQFQLGEAMPVAAANPAGGLAGAGVGVGMGWAMAQQLGPAGGPPAGSPGAAVGGVPPAPPAGPLWHLAADGRSSGPFTTAQLVEAARDGRLRAQSLVWCAGLARWTAAGEVPELAACFGPPPPPAA